MARVTPGQGAAPGILLRARVNAEEAVASAAGHRPHRREESGAIAHDAFLSYRHRDSRESAARLFQLLTQRGISVYLDEHEIVHGATISDSVASGLAGARLFIAWYSKGYLESEACFLELARMLAASASGAPLPIFVVNPERDAAHILPKWLGDVRRYDLTKGTMEGLAEAVAAQVAAAPPAHAAPPPVPERFGSYPSARPEWLAGRNPQVFEIFDAFHAHERPDTTRRFRSLDVVVAGPAGIGKSNLVQRYEALLGPRYSGGVHWFDFGVARGKGDAASSSLDQRLALALERGWVAPRSIQGAGPKTIAILVDAAIRRNIGRGGPYLWIVENVSEADLAEGKWLAPSAGGFAIATSIVAPESSGTRAIALQALTAEAMRESLANGLPAGCTRDQLERLERATAGYPGRLAAILAEARAFGIEAVLAHYEADPAGAAGIAAAYQPLLDSLDARDRFYLDTLSVLLPTAIPAALADLLAADKADRSVLATLKRLRELALIRGLGDGGIAIERPARQLLGVAPAAAREVAATALHRLMPASTRTPLTAQLVQLAAHARHLTVDVDSDAAAVLLMRLGAYHTLIGDKAAEQDAFERSHAWLSRNRGPRDAQTLEALRELAASFRYTDREAELLTQALDLMGTAPSLERVKLLHALSIAQEESPGEALATSDRAIAMLERLPPGEDALHRRMMLMNSRALFLLSLGRDQDAAACLEASWEAAQAFAPEDGDRLRCVATYAVLTLPSAPERSLTLLRENLDTTRRLYGRRHHLVSWAACDLFFTTFRCGLTAEAKSVFLRDLAWLFLVPDDRLNEINRLTREKIAKGAIGLMSTYRKYRMFTPLLRDPDGRADQMELMLMAAWLLKAPADHPDFAFMLSAYLRAGGRRRDRMKARMAMRWERSFPRFVSVREIQHVKRCARAIRRFRRWRRFRAALAGAGRFASFGDRRA